jgi:signal transduction histidine kinase
MDDDLPVPLARRLTGRHKVALDTLLAAALAASSVPVTARDLHTAQPHSPAITTLGYLAVAAASVPLPLRRRHPRTVLGSALAGAAVLIALGIRMPVQLGAGFAMYSLAATSASALPYWAVAAATAPMAAVGLTVWDSQAAYAAILVTGSVLVGWLAGENSRARRSFTAALAERERERAWRTAMEERARIARELHDVVAHTMSVIAVRSGVARMISAAQPGTAAEALSLIETISGRGLDELQRIVGVLREDSEPGTAGHGRADFGPAPGLADLPELVSQVAAAGVHVDVRIEGAPRPLPPTEDLSAYRIAQEALTNVVRHSGAGTATLSVRYRPGTVEIECVDPGGQRPGRVAARAANGGHGIVGMRERVTLFGGELTAGQDGQGFRVLARLPAARDER